MDNLTDISLPFSKQKQEAIIGHILNNKNFFRLITPKIKSNWFVSPICQKVYKLALGFNEKYDCPPTQIDILNSSLFAIMGQVERQEIEAQINICLLASSVLRISDIRQELNEWLHSVILINALKQASNDFNNKEISACHKRLTDAVREVSNTNFLTSDVVEFKDFKNYLEQSQLERTTAISTGLSILDKALLDTSTGGGLLLGDTTIVLGSINQGKTSMLVSVACANILMGKSVLFMTHEGNPKEIRLKFLCNLLRMSLGNLFETKTHQDTINKLTVITKLLDDNLRYIPYNKAGSMFIENVVPIIRAAQEERMAGHLGQGYDLLISDYPALLSTEMAARGHLPKREIDRIVYDNYVQLALEYGFHSLLAIQTNREGSKINKGISSDQRLLEIEDVSESWGPMASASNVISLNRPPWAEMRNIMIFNIAKTRSSKKGTTVAAKTRFDMSITHSNEFGGCMMSTGNFNQELITPDFIDRFKNREVPIIELSRLET